MTGAASNSKDSLNLWKLLGSMKFAIWILVAAALLSLLALLASELLPMEAQMSSAAKFLQLSDPFRSWWFRALLGILAISLTVCVTERTPILLRQAFGRTFRTDVNQFKGRVGTLSASTSDSEEKINRYLKSLGLNVSSTDTPEGKAFAGVSGGISRLGPLLTHLGLLLLILGGLSTGISGKSTRVSGSPGDTVTKADWNFSLKIEDFNILYYPLAIGQWVEASGNARGKIAEIASDSVRIGFAAHNNQEFFRWYPADSVRNDFLTFQGGVASPYQGNVKSYQTSATVLLSDQPVFTRHIEVNHPLRYRGYRFYQSSFELQEIRTEVDSVIVVCKNDSDESVKLTLAVGGEAVSIPWDDKRIAVAAFYPDFRLDGNMEAFSASGQMNNPAARAIVYEDGAEVGRQWIFPRDLGGMGHSASQLNLKLENVKGVRTAPGGYRTILEVNKDRGAWLIWAGFILATLGLTLAYSLTYRKAWALIQIDDGGVETVFAAVSSNREETNFNEKSTSVFSEVFH